MAYTSTADAKLPANGEFGQDIGNSTEAMADLHISGSDPRLFPGIFTRDHRSDSLRNLTQIGDWTVNSNESPGDEDDV